MQNYPENLTLKNDWNPYLFINLWQKLLTVFLCIEFDQTLDILNQKSYYFSSNCFEFHVSPAWPSYAELLNRVAQSRQICFENTYFDEF